MNIWKIHQLLTNLVELLSFVPRKIVQIFLIYVIAVFIVIAGYNIPASVAVSKDSSTYRTFTDWCLNKENLQSGTNNEPIL